eukprot:c5670_g1_i1.p1 GENE.c5670_g1_i1~~c5670_g1_i1.p1  ORF type:complete len:264 (-),score=55.32 c5670_g1_i1:109-900(-)
MSFENDRFLPREVEKFLPIIARFLLVSTFFEDAVRLVVDYETQKRYLGTRIGSTLAPGFICLCFLLQVVGGGMVLTMHRLVRFAVLALTTNIVAQVVVYGLIVDPLVIARNLALIGSLLLLVSQQSVNEHRKGLFSAPLISSVASTSYLLLAGRVLLVLLLIAEFPLNEGLTLTNILLIVVVGIPLLLVVVGMRTRESAIFLLVVVSALNIVVNSFWVLDSNNHARDFHKYYFFQTLSIMGGLILLVSLGAGDLSFDARKKKF